MATKNDGVFDTSIKAWLHAMSKAGRIQKGGKLVFVNKKTRAAVRSSPSGAQSVE